MFAINRAGVLSIEPAKAKRALNTQKPIQKTSAPASAGGSVRLQE